MTKLKRWAKPAATEAASLEANETNLTYDIAGNNITASASCCNLKTYTYVKANEYAFPTQVARGAGGQLTSEYPSNRVVNYNYQTGYGLTSVNDASRTYVSGVSYTAHGAMSGEALGNGAVHTMAFNNRLQLSQLNLTKSGTERQRYDHVYGQYDETKNQDRLEFTPPGVARLVQSLPSACPPNSIRPGV